MKKSHVNIPVFIPHLGCPNMCVFCNQRAISGVCSFIPEKAKEDIEAVLSTVKNMREGVEIAFFGGSFTGIDRELMITLLDLAEGYVRAGYVSGIRMSTRPDYISDEIISVLEHYTVSAVELGIQSMSDAVLMKSKRGHTADDTRKAMRLLKEAGYNTVGQMMIGLPGSLSDDEIRTAREICTMGAKASRIYPTVVFRDTELCSMTLSGEYTPLTHDEAVKRGADVLEVFINNGVDCIRIGLCDSENLHSENTYFAGDNSPSLGEEVISEIYRRRMTDEIEKLEPDARDGIIAEVRLGDISAAVGHYGCNKKYIKEKYNVRNIKFAENEQLARYDIKIRSTIGKGKNVLKIT